MKTIYKYTLEEESQQHVLMHKFAKILTAQLQHGTIQLWAEIDTNQPINEKREILICGTGYELHDHCEKYISTIQQGMFVWHIYEGNYSYRSAE